MSNPTEAENPQAPEPGWDTEQSVVLDALKTVTDPEIGVNVVDLGLIYTIEVVERTVNVEMTLTTPACPAAPQILSDATNAIEALESVDKANVKLVMDPPWSTDRMSEDAKDELGIF